MPRRPPEVPFESLLDRAAPRPFFHGSSSLALVSVEEGRADVRRSYEASLASLGGTYFSRSPWEASGYARRAARAVGGEPVLLWVRRPPWRELLPDEDWAEVAMREAPQRPDGDLRDRRLQDFMDDAWDRHNETGMDLLGLYKERYDELNARHGITARDSWRWIGACRQAGPLRADQVRAWARVPEGAAAGGPRVSGTPWDPPSLPFVLGALGGEAPRT